MSRLNKKRQFQRHSLPPLAETCAIFKGFAKGENRSKRVRELLETVIQRARRTTPQPFYAMREVGAFFKIPVTTVARIYRRLAREGILTLVRGSQTMMASRLPRPRLAVRGVVCMPIWLPGFVTFLEWRRLFTQLEEELSRHRFILEPIFYKQGEEEHPDFVERVLKFNPDYLLWNHPVRADASTIQSIADTGVLPMVIQNAATPLLLSGRIYRQSLERGLRQGLREWKASGEIDRIVIPLFAPQSLALFEPIKTCGLPYQTRFFPVDTKDRSPIKKFLHQLALKPRTGIIFGDDLFYSQLCTRIPDDLLKLFSRYRVMVLREVMLPSLQLPPEGTMVDTLFSSGRQLARRIAQDLHSTRSSLAVEEVIFEAEWRPRVPLAEIAPRDLVE